MRPNPRGKPTVSLAFALTLTLTSGGASGAEPEIEEILVIGSKTNASRQELSTSTGYFSEERLQDDAIYNVEDIFARTANAFTGTAGFGAYSIRGVNNNGITGAFNASNALASVVVNQVALGVSSGDYVKPSMFDANSAEILRGPQTAVQGPNSLIGAVYINYNKPSFDAGNEGLLRLEGGELDTLRAGLVQNIVLADDVFAARIALEKRETEGDATNSTTGSDDVQREDEETARLALLYRPNGTDDLTFEFTYLRNESDSNAFGLVVPPPGGDLFDRVQPYNVDDEYPSDFDQLSLQVGWQISDRWRLTSITGSNQFELFQGFDGDLTAFDFLAVQGFIEEELLSQELRLNFEGDRLSGLLGAFYSDGEYRSGFSGVGIFPDGEGGVAPFNTTTDTLETITQQAVFGQVTWSFADAFRLTAGARLNREERDNDNFADNNGLVSDLSASETFDQFIPSLALSYDLSDTTSVGISYAQGIQAGGIAFAVFLGQSNPYDEETTENYELFLRHQSADGRFILNANLFYIDWTDQQITSTLPGGFPGFDDFVINAGRSTVRGVEVEIEWSPLDGLDLFTSIGVTDTEFDEFVLNGQDLSGRAFPGAPDFNVTLGANWRNAQGWFAAGSYSYVDSAYTEVSAPAITEISERNLLSGRLGYEADQWRAYLWGTNLLDDEYELGLFDGTVFGLGGAYGRVGQPRTLGVGFQYNW
ncbi:MAG: TonB-dependent receptor [Pseudomonadota bacterium]